MALPPVPQVSPSSTYTGQPVKYEDMDSEQEGNASEEPTRGRRASSRRQPSQSPQPRVMDDEEMRLSMSEKEYKRMRRQGALLYVMLDSC